MRVDYCGDLQRRVGAFKREVNVIKLLYHKDLQLSGNLQYCHVRYRSGALQLRLADGDSLPVVSLSIDGRDNRVVVHLFSLFPSLLEALSLAILVQSFA